MPQVEKINPYSGDTRNKGEQIRDMFDAIAPAYDFMNRAMTFGIDKLWRRSAVREVERGKPLNVLDVATGTGDLAIALAHRLPQARITGVDLSEEMMAVGRAKVHAAGLDGRISFQAGDCLTLPFADGSFDAVTVAYGVRNFADIPGGYSEMLRVLRPGGRLVVLELSTPGNPLVRPIYKLYTSTIIPLAGRLVSKDVRAYSYLPESIAAVPQGENMAAIMKETGFASTAFRRFTFGTCTLYTGIKK